MSVLAFAVVTLAGGVGAVCRFVLDGAVTAKVRGELPWGTVVVNVSGSLLLGLLAGSGAGHLLADGWPVVAGVGFLGGYTTFSTASVETVRLLQQDGARAGVAHGLGMAALTTAAAGLGLWIGGLVAGAWG